MRAAISPSAMVSSCIAMPSSPGAAPSFSIMPSTSAADMGAADWLAARPTSSSRVRTSIAFAGRLAGSLFIRRRTKSSRSRATQPRGAHAARGRGVAAQVTEGSVERELPERRLATSRARRRGPERIHVAARVGETTLDLLGRDGLRTRRGREELGAAVRRARARPQAIGPCVEQDHPLRAVRRALRDHVFELRSPCEKPASMGAPSPSSTAFKKRSRLVDVSGPLRATRVAGVCPSTKWCAA